jgi:hypothetical protein
MLMPGGGVILADAALLDGTFKCSRAVVGALPEGD